MGVDPVLAEIEAEIVELEMDLRVAREMKNWWLRRHPPTTPVMAVAAMLTPSSAPAVPLPSVPRLRRLNHYIRHVLSDGKPRLVNEIVEECQALGWTTASARPDQLVRNVLHEMADATVIDRYWTIALPEEASA